MAALPEAEGMKRDLDGTTQYLPYSEWIRGHIFKLVPNLVDAFGLRTSAWEERGRKESSCCP